MFIVTHHCHANLSFSVGGFYSELLRSSVMQHLLQVCWSTRSKVRVSQQVCGNRSLAECTPTGLARRVLGTAVSCVVSFPLRHQEVGGITPVVEATNRSWQRSSYLLKVFRESPVEPQFESDSKPQSVSSTENRDDNLCWPLRVTLSDSRVKSIQ